MSEPITSSFLKEIKNPITLLIIGILAIFIAVGFISFQVYNHIPTQIKGIEQDIKDVKEELKQDINRLEDKMGRLEDKMDSQYKELNNKMDKLNERMDKVLYYLIDNKGKK